MKNTNVTVESVSGEPRWLRRKEERPGEILDAALDCFAETGFAATRLDDIAARAGVTKGTLYLYFESKEDIFKSVIRSKVAVNFDYLEKIAADDSKTSAQMVREILAFWSEDFLPSRAGVVPKLIFTEGIKFPDISKFFLQEVIYRNFRLLSDIINRGVEGGEFRAVDVENTIRCLTAPILFTTLWKHSLEPNTDKKLDIGSFFNTFLDLILNGLNKASSKNDCVV